MKTPVLLPLTLPPVQNVSDFVLSDFFSRSSLPALVCGASGKQFTYGEVSSLSRQWGAALLHTGLKPGDKVAVIVPNCPEVSRAYNQPPSFFPSLVRCCSGVWEWG